MNILFITIGDCTVASSRVYVYQYLKYLKNEGFNTRIYNFHSVSYVNSHKSGVLRYIRAFQIYFTYLLKICRVNYYLFFISKYDVVFCQKVIIQPLTAKWLKLRKVKMIYCIDDAVHLRDSFLKIGGIRKSNFQTFLELVDNIIIGSDHYFDVFSYLNRNISFVPNAVETSRYYHITGSKLTIGWVGSSSTSTYLNNIAVVLEEIYSRFQDQVRIKIVGAQREKLRGLDFCEFFDWSQDNEYELISDFDIGIMPLPNNEWEIGKCGYKLIQYMAVGIPSLVSPVGINRKYIKESGAGYLCNTDDDWKNNFSELIENKDLRLNLGAKGRLYAEKNNDTSIVYNTYSQVLKTI